MNDFENDGSGTGMKIEKQPALWLAIANLNIFGLGYWLSGKKLRGPLSLAGGAILLTAGHLLNASKNPLLWGTLFLALFIGMALDSLMFFEIIDYTPRLVLRKEEIDLAPVLQKSTLILPALAILTNVVFYGGFLLYRSSSSNLYQAGSAAYEDNDLQGALENWQSLSNWYRLSLNPQVVEAQLLLGEVDMLITTNSLLDEGQFSQALEEIERFYELYPTSPKKINMAEIGVFAYIGWAQKLAGQNEFDDGLEKLNTLQEDFPAQAQAHQQQVDNAYIEHYLAWSNYLRTQKEFAPAVENYDYLMKTYPKADQYEAFYNSAAQAHVDWSIQLAEQNDYEQAAAKLLTVREIYGDSAAASDASQMLPEIYLNWAVQLDEEEDYEQAVVKLRIVLVSYGNSTAASDAGQMLPQVYLSWAGQLAEQKDYQQAALKLQIILDNYSNASAAADAGQMLPQVNLELGKQLSSQQAYLRAIEKFEEIIILGESNSFFNEANEEYNKTVLLLAGDNGPDGQKVLAEALTQACNGEIPSHPSVALLTDEPGKILNCYGEIEGGVGGATWWGIPGELLATTPGNFHYTVLRIDDTLLLQSCSYTEGRIFYRYQDSDEVVIRSVATGKQVAKKTFYGGYPEACPFFHFFQYSTDSNMGEQVSNTTINEWIAGVLE